MQHLLEPGNEVPKVALVTGGASGIGRAIAIKLSSEGIATVIADKDKFAAQQLATEIGGLALCADLRDAHACEYVVEQTKEAYGAVDILINNAGFQHVSSIEDFSPEIWNDMIALMLTAPFLLTKYVWAGMKRKQWGRIVNIASIHGQIASPFKAGYTSAKHGLVGFTKTAALEGGEHGITVNAVSPAYVRTPLVEKQIEDQAGRHGISKEDVVSRIMLEPAAVKRLIEPHEVAGLVAYLCTDDAKSVTGANLTMDGGWTAR